MREEKYRLFAALLRLAICNVPLTDEQKAACDDEMIAALYELSTKQDVAHLIAFALQSNKLLHKDSEFGEKFLKKLHAAIYRYEKLNYETARICDTLEAEGIDFLPLKGTVLRRYYTIPWLRTSCDIDILVHGEDVERAAAALEEKLGYRRDIVESHNLSMYSPDGVHFELHYTLIEDGLAGKADKPLEKIWEYTVSANGSAHMKELADDMFYYYHIAHMAKHFLLGGCGARSLVDVWILHNRSGCDLKNRGVLLDEGGLSAFEKRVCQLSEVWFDGKEADDVIVRMEQYVLSGGTYGSLENRISVGRARNGGSAGFLWSRLWLPYDVLRFEFPSLTGRKWLLPFYQIARWFRALFGDGRKRMVREIKRNSQISEEENDQTMSLLDEMGLR